MPSKRFLITAGPTREAIDPVRYITNHSSGKMGYAIAEAARSGGYEVTLITGPVDLAVPANISLIRIETTEQLSEAVLSEFESSDCLIMAAAPADYRPKRYSDSKIKKSETDFMLSLEPTPDILSQVAKVRRPDQFVVGFALETDNAVENGKKKLIKKKLDLIVVNSPSADSGFNSDTNRVTLIDKSGLVDQWKLMPKREIADKLLDTIRKMW